MYNKRIGIILIATIMLLAYDVNVWANNINDLKNQIQEAQDKLNETNTTISEIGSVVESIHGEIEDIDMELVDVIANISMIEEEIEQKEVEIDNTTIKLDEAKKEEAIQYDAMKERIRYMYEKGEESYLALMLDASGFSDMVNKGEYILAVYDYDRKMLDEYKAIVAEVDALMQQLEEEKSQLETGKAELKLEQEALDVMLAQKKEEAEDYERELARARQEAATYKAQIKKKNAEIRRIEEEARKAAEAARKAAEATRRASQSGGSGSSSSSVPIPSNPGSAGGREIASFASQFVGNPYVSGGTSLTDGADCSGFTYAVYKSFGYSIPRTSTSQRSAGSEVSYSDAAPGDIICYSGHVGIYVGNGQIVHASTPATGIKYSIATYRDIISVRRIVR